MSPNKPGLLHYRRLIDEFAKPDLRSIGDSVERIGSRTPSEAGNLPVLKNSNQRMCLFRKRPRLHRRQFGKVLVSSTRAHQSDDPTFKMRVANQLQITSG